MTSGFFSGKVLRGLAVRVLFFLSLALLPIGLIAIGQTQEISKQNRRNAELSLLSVTEQASQAERRVLQEAFSAAEALGSIIGLHRADVDACSSFFKEYIEVNPTYLLAGLIEPDGLMACSSAETSIDFSGSDSFEEAMKQPGRRAQTLETGASTKRPVTVVTTPIFDKDGLSGIVALSIPAETFASLEEPELSVAPLALMTFNQKGHILTTERDPETVASEVPRDVALRVFAGQGENVFTAQNKDGEKRVYAVQPIISDTVFAVSVWPMNTPFLNPPLSTTLSAFLPIAMWAASLIVAFWSLNRLAIRHIRKLGRQMRRFALNRNLPRETLGAGVPTELVEMETAFINMGESILRDEATLEDSLREKNILLKEVHHRVKNNLQLISSIMNMQIRQAKNDDVARVLRRLQERILGLATVHKNLYQNNDLVRVDASVLLHEVVNQLLSVGLVPGSKARVTQTYEPISIDADDAAPLTLLVSEAMTNALKNVNHYGGDTAEITITLSSVDPDHARLEVMNTKGGTPEQDGTGLGSRLIEAFARQLNGQIEIAEDDHTYRMMITFHVPQYSKQTYDY